MAADNECPAVPGTARCETSLQQTSLRPHRNGGADPTDPTDPTETGELILQTPQERGELILQTPQTNPTEMGGADPTGRVRS